MKKLTATWTRDPIRHVPSWQIPVSALSWTVTLHDRDGQAETFVVYECPACGAVSRTEPGAPCHTSGTVLPS